LEHSYRIHGSSADTNTPLPTETDVFATETTGSGIFGIATETNVCISDPTVAAGCSGGLRNKPTKRKVPIKSIIGFVAGVLVLLFIMLALVIFFYRKKKNQRQLAANE